MTSIATISAKTSKIEVDDERSLRKAFLKLIETAGNAPDHFAVMNVSLPKKSEERYASGDSGFRSPNGQPFKPRFPHQISVSCSTFGNGEYAVLQFETSGETLKFSRYRKDGELFKDGFQDLLWTYFADRSKLSKIPRAPNHHLDVESCVPDGCQSDSEIF